MHQNIKLYALSCTVFVFQRYLSRAVRKGSCLSPVIVLGNIQQLALFHHYSYSRPAVLKWG